MSDSTVTPFILDATVLDMQETYEAMKEDIKLNRIEFTFPGGLNQVNLKDECRALCNIEDFDMMYDLSMQMLEGKPLTIAIKNYDGTKTTLCDLQITDRFMDLRGSDVISTYPVLVVWLCEFIGATIAKKFPVPMKNQSQPQKAPENQMK
jgi:hypothetical protein